MKKIFFITLGIMSALAACQDDPKTTVNPEDIEASRWMLSGAGELFVTQSDVFILEKDLAESFFDTIRWTATDFGYSAAVTYSIQMALEKPDGTITNFKTVASTSKTFYAFAVKEINQCILNGGGLKRVKNNMIVRIAASIGMSYPAVLSGEHRFTATTYSTDPDLLYFVSAVTGDRESAEYIFSKNWNSVYDGFAYIPYGGDGIWLVEEIDAEATKWGIASSTAQGSALSLVKKADGGQPIMPGAFGTGNVETSFVDSAYYRIYATVAPNETNKRIQIYRFYDDFFIGGQRNMNYKEWGMNMSGQFPKIPAWNVLQEPAPSNPANHYVWGTGAKLTYYPKDRVWKTNVVYVPKFQTGAGVPPQAENASPFEFKLRANWCCSFNIETGAATSTWQAGVNLGGRQTDAVIENGRQIGLIGGPGTGPENPGNGNIKVNVNAGYYYWKVYLNEYPCRYELVPAVID